MVLTYSYSGEITGKQIHQNFILKTIFQEQPLGQQSIKQTSFTISMLSLQNSVVTVYVRVRKLFLSRVR